MTKFRLMITIGTLAALVVVARLLLALPGSELQQSVIQETPDQLDTRDSDADIVAALAALRAELVASNRQSLVMQKELVRLREDLHELREQVETEPVTSHSAGTYELPTMAPSPEASEQNQDPGQHTEVAEADFIDEYIDSAWAYQMNERITAIFENPESGLQALLTDIQCRSASCRVEVTHHDPIAAEDFGMRFPASVAGDFTEISYHYPEDGSVVMFLSQGWQSTQ